MVLFLFLSLSSSFTSLSLSPLLFFFFMCRLKLFSFRRKKARNQAMTICLKFWWLANKELARHRVCTASPPFFVSFSHSLFPSHSAVIKRYVHNIYSVHYKATIGVDFALKVINWDENSVVRLQLWDIAGSSTSPIFLHLVAQFCLSFL